MGPTSPDLSFKFNRTIGKNMFIKNISNSLQKVKRVIPGLCHNLKKNKVYLEFSYYSSFHIDLAAICRNQVIGLNKCCHSENFLQLHNFFSLRKTPRGLISKCEISLFFCCCCTVCRYKNN